MPPARNDKGVQHVDELGRQRAVMPARLRPVLEAPSKVHDPHLGLAVERHPRLVVLERLLTPRPQMPGGPANAIRQNLHAGPPLDPP
jgi:hypothetical protein